jgi:quinol monooxygenase YgiN
MIVSAATKDRSLNAPLVYVDHSDIRPGKVGEVTRAVSALVEYVRQREPQLLSYAFHIDADALTMVVVAVHPDSASLERHLQIGGPEFRKVGEFIELRLIEVYGDPGPMVSELLEEKARVLGRGARVVVLDRTVGFARFAPANRELAPSRAPDPTMETGG